MVALAPLLFLDPVTKVQELHTIFVDMIACKSRDAFTSKLKGQLQDSNLLATVLLNANVGFLAITTVDKGGRSFVQLASYMSLVTSLGSIVLGLVFVSRDRTSGENTASETVSNSCCITALFLKAVGSGNISIKISPQKTRTGEAGDNIQPPKSVADVGYDLLLCGVLSQLVDSW
ncbi:hypothetical protein AZE42_04111 [Rhizopogon vesiculosus]|uniref:Uncharacterized protein n=1 Tax=Rhizopogon vesiculosus TaxID=180088 RepID=A0A1J8RIF0_9AGAM|nr:hypothetical protein AZE42_04111 [Rhizopogon vesiculosus]